jgi:hypothetical protein
MNIASGQGIFYFLDRLNRNLMIIVDFHDARYKIRHPQNMHFY